MRRPGTHWLKQLAPYLAGAFFILHLVAADQGSLVEAGDLLVPLGATMIVGGVVHVAAWALTRSWTKAALIAWVGVVGFSACGLLIQSLGVIGAIGPTPPELVVLALFATAGGGLTVAAVATPRRLSGLLAYVTVVSALVAGLNGFEAARVLTSGPAPLAGPLPPSGIAAPAARGRPPDVLLLILDKYTGTRTLAEQYGFDNGAVVRFLRDRGFLIPAAPRPNYVQTFLSLGSFLNLAYLDSLILLDGTETRDRSSVHASIERNRLAAFFHERGYRFVFLPTGYEATRQNRYADVQLPDPGTLRPEFVTAWYQTTPLPALHRLSCAVAGCDFPTPYVPETAALIDWKFERLAALAGGGRPTFVLAHLTVPHEPFLYRADCRHRVPWWPFREQGVPTDTIRAAYIEQIQCVNRKVESVVTAWLARSRVPPLILIQGDHGHGLSSRNLPGDDRLSPAQTRDRLSVFAAYRVPGARPGELPDTVTPVNAMRYALRTTFGADLPPLPDASYWSSFQRPFRMKLMRIR